MLIHNAEVTGSLKINNVPYNSGSFSGSFRGDGSQLTGVTGATTASYVEYSNVGNKPALVSGSSQITYSGLSGIPSGIVSGSSQVTYSGLTGIPAGIVSGSSQVTYSGLTGIPAGIVSGSAQITGFGIFATTGSNQFNGSQAVTGSLTVTGQVVAQTLNVQQVTSSIVYSSGSNIFGNSLSNTQQFTGSVSVTGSLTVNGAGTFASSVTANSVMSLGNDGTFGSTYKTLGLTGNTTGTHRIFAGTADDMYFAAATSRGFEFRANGGGVGNLNINSNGKIGIGTTSPANKLFVVASGTATTNGNNSGIFISHLTTGATTDGIGIGSNGSESYKWIQTYFGNLSLNPAGNNVGIGTTSPSGIVGIKASGADGLVMEPDSASVNNSSRIFFSSSVQTFGVFNNSADLRFTYDAIPGNTSGTSLARFTNTGKYFRMEAGTGGIQFGGDTSADNALDDYEEGTFTPVIIGSSTAGTATYGAANGLYTKIGRAVTYNLYVDWSAGNGTGNLRVSGLPFTSVNINVYPASAIGETQGISLSANGIMTARVNPNSTQIFITQYPAGGGAAASVNYDDAGYLVLAGTYYI